VQSEIIQTPDQGFNIARAEARLPRWMIGIAMAVPLAILVSGHARVAAGFAFGAALSVLNFYWLHQAIQNLFVAGQTRVPRRVIAKFALRYPLAIMALYLFYKTSWLPSTAILAGLFVPVGGVLIEALFQVREGLRGV
jgi:ATP synthase I subunit